VHGLGFRVEGLEFQGLPHFGIAVKRSGFRMYGLRQVFRIQIRSFGFRVWVVRGVVGFLV
jgi:hypothetical protein